MARLLTAKGSYWGATFIDDFQSLGDINDHILRFPYSRPIPAANNYVTFISHCNPLDPCFIIGKKKVLGYIGGSESLWGVQKLLWHSILLMTSGCPLTPGRSRVSPRELRWNILTLYDFWWVLKLWHSVVVRFVKTVPFLWFLTWLLWKQEKGER